jgi:hypothetical protein
MARRERVLVRGRRGADNSNDFIQTPKMELNSDRESRNFDENTPTLLAGTEIRIDYKPLVIQFLQVDYP